MKIGIRRLATRNRPKIFERSFIGSFKILSDRRRQMDCHIVSVRYRHYLSASKANEQLSSNIIAANQQLRIMCGCIGFNNGSNNNIIDVQGIDSVRELGYFYDDATNLCKTIRCPGGHLPNPAFVAGAVPLLPATNPYVGIMVSQTG